jgi:hypothetical protein
MRLLNCANLSFKELLTLSNCPTYAILSHMWGEEEIIFDDIHRGKSKFQHKKGYAKIEGCCNQAIRDGYEWVRSVDLSGQSKGINFRKWLNHIGLDRYLLHRQIQ